MAFVVDPRIDDVERIVLDLIASVQSEAVDNGIAANAEGDLVELVGEQMVDIVLQLRRLIGTAKVYAVADRSTWNTDGPLQYRIVVEEGE